MSIIDSVFPQVSPPGPEHCCLTFNWSQEEEAHHPCSGFSLLAAHGF